MSAQNQNRVNERSIYDLTQHEYDELLARLVDADSIVSWCRHRHHNDPEVRRDMDDFTVFARKHGRRRRDPSSASERKPNATR